MLPALVELKICSKAKNQTLNKHNVWWAVVRTVRNKEACIGKRSKLRFFSFTFVFPEVAHSWGKGFLKAFQTATWDLVDNLCSLCRRWWKMKKMIFWKVKLGLHRAPLMRISAVLQAVWAPHLSYTCQTSPPWSQGFVIETDIPPVVPFSTKVHTVWASRWTRASTCFRHLTFKLDLL